MSPYLPVSPFPDNFWTRWNIALLLLAFVGAALGALGWWLPWVLPPNGAAALVLLGLDLGEFLKFTSLWEQDAYVWGTIVWERHAFFLPPALASLSLSLLATHVSVRWRVPVAVLAGLLAFTLFPEFERWGEFLQPEFWFQMSLGAVGLIVAALVLVMGSHALRRPIAVLGLLVAAAGALLPVWAFWRVERVLEWLYGTQIVWGPGLWVSSAGFALAAIGWGVAVGSMSDEVAQHD